MLHDPVIDVFSTTKESIAAIRKAIAVYVSVYAGNDIPYWKVTKQEAIANITSNPHFFDSFRVELHDNNIVYIEGGINH